ncbi:hypothetical protein MAPG_10477 [Magnaporthiopsis poae ATCC 64411]|uniref:Uncharacterized protein n=1 Tax=Magnaporthiopsis poae (strain ATCC 64411 / 73-15) TaxID=644358 RepID=A0A0C4ECP5_MAGP6|nr:hypothetical protein MAPG_10477 [Magnaporthiopsis poae ATCC 64411]
MHDELRKCAAALSPKDDQQWLALLQVTAQVLGHGTISKRLSAELVALSLGVARESWSTDALHGAIEYGDDEAIEDLLKDEDLTKQLDSGHKPRWTAMHAAADRGSLQLVARLWGAEFRESVNVPCPDPDCCTLVFVACSRGFAYIAEFLVSKRAHLEDYSGPLDQTALHAASRHHGHWSTTTMLIDNKAAITSADASGNSALHLTIEKGHVRVAERLVDAFPDIPAASDASQTSDRSNAITPQSEEEGSVTPIHEDLPVRYRRLMAAFGMFEGRGGHNAMSTKRDNRLAPLNRANLAGVSAPFAAANRDLLTVGRRPLERRADPSLVDDRSRLPIHMAAEAGSVSLIIDLLDKGTEMKHGLAAIPLHSSCYRDANGRTALSAGMCRRPLTGGRVPHESPRQEGMGSRACLCGALRPPRRRKAPARHGMPRRTARKPPAARRLSPLRYPGGQARMAEMLLLRETTPVITNPKGKDALFAAVEAEELDTFRLLIDLGADMEAEGLDGSTILTRAMFLKHTALVRLLFERGVKLRLRWHSYDSLLGFSDGFSIPPITSLLLGHGFRGTTKDATSPQGSECAEFLEVMLRNRAVAASIDHQQPGLGTPLQAAVAAPARSRDMAKMLLKHGADAEIIAGRFGTTLNAACAAANLEVVEDLVDILPKEVITSTTGKYGTAIQSAIVGCRDRGPTETTIEILDLLAAKGCSALGKGGFYHTALHAAIYFSPPEVIDWIVKKNQKVIFAIHCAAVSKDEKIMAKALSHWSDYPDADVVTKHTDVDGWTPLRWACRQGNREIVEALLGARGGPRGPDAPLMDGPPHRHPERRHRRRVPSATFAGKAAGRDHGPPDGLYYKAAINQCRGRYGHSAQDAEPVRAHDGTAPRGRGHVQRSEGQTKSKTNQSDANEF